LLSHCQKGLEHPVDVLVVVAGRRFVEHTRLGRSTIARATAVRCCSPSQVWRAIRPSMWATPSSCSANHAGLRIRRSGAARHSGPGLITQAGHGCSLASEALARRWRARLCNARISGSAGAPPAGTCHGTECVYLRRESVPS
jgi:hypothetical protein